MSDETNHQPEQKQLTEAEYKKMRDDRFKGLKEELPLMRLEAEYETLLATIEVQRATKAMAIRQLYSMYQQPQPQVKIPDPIPPGEGPGPKEDPKARTLKVVEPETVSTPTVE